MMKPEDRSRAARAELDRLKDEGGLFAMSGLKLGARSIGGHFRGDDVAPDDAVAVWGTRIGRALGALAVIGLGIWLVGHLGR